MGNTKHDDKYRKNIVKQLDVGDKLHRCMDQLCSVKYLLFPQKYSRGAIKCPKYDSES